MNKIWFSLLVSTCLLTSSLSVAENSLRWTLNTSIHRAINVAPEMKTAAAEIGKQQGKLVQASAWPNPSISIQVDDSLGLEDTSGGFTVTQVAISQALPMGRLNLQRQQAEAGLASAQAQRRQQQLLLEYKVAQRLHNFQLTEAKLKLAEKRLRQAKSYQNRNRKDNRNNADVLIRYLSPLERMRLDIVLQAAIQTMEVAEGEFNEAAASFKALLGLPIAKKINLTPLLSVPALQDLTTLENNLQNHPALEADKQMITYSQTGVAVAKSMRFADPIITVFSGEGFYAGSRQQSNGLMLSVKVPLWNQNSGAVTQARYTVYQAQEDFRLQQRDLKTNLYKSYLHLGHLIKQAAHYRSKLLKPAKRVFTLTRKGFAAGELNILSLIDANNTYFDAQERYLELLQEGWLELAEVRKSAGLFVANNVVAFNFGEDK